MSDKSMEMSVRVASLEYLGLVAARLRRDSVTSRAKLSTMDGVVRDIKAVEEKDGGEGMVSIRKKFTPIQIIQYKIIYSSTKLILHKIFYIVYVLGRLSRKSVRRESVTQPYLL